MRPLVPTVIRREQDQAVLIQPGLADRLHDSAHIAVVLGDLFQVRARAIAVFVSRSINVIQLHIKYLGIVRANVSVTAGTNSGSGSETK